MGHILAISVIVVSFTTIISISAQEKYDIPAWVKNVAGFWVEDEITDQDFGDAISFLINENIIKIPENSQLQDENSQLRDENSQLKNTYSQLQIKNSEATDLLVQRDGELVSALNKINQLQQEISELTSNITSDDVIVPESSLTVSVDSLNPYENGDMVKINGKIVGIEGIGLSLKIINPDGNVILSDVLSPRSGGSFSTSFIMGDPSFNEFGKYIVKVEFGSVKAETSFWYNPS